MRRLATFAMLLAFGALAAAAPVPAGKPAAIPTELPLPASSVMLGQLTDYPQFVDKFQKMMMASFGKEGPKLWQDLLDLNKDDPPSPLALKGIAKGGKIYVAITSFEFDADEPPFVASVPVDDAKLFRTTFLEPMKVGNVEKMNGYEKIALKEGDRPMYWLEQKDRVVITASKELAEQYTKPFEPFKTKSLGDSAESFFAADAAYYVSIEAVREKFGDTIAQFRGIIPLILQQAGGQMDKTQLEATKWMAETALQMLDDGKGVVVAGTFKPDGVALRLHLAFTPNSPCAKVTAGETPKPAAKGAQYSPDFGLHATNFFTGKVNGALAKLNREFTAADGDEAGEKAIAAFREAEATATASGFSMNFDRTGISMAEIPDAAAAAKAFVAMMKGVGDGMKFQQIPLKGKPVVGGELIVGDTTFTQVKLAFDFEAFGNGQPEPVREAAVKSAKALLPETLSIWVGGTKTSFLRIVAKDEKAAKAIAEKLLAGGVPNNAAAAQATAGLSGEVGACFLLDAIALANFAGDYLPAMLGAMPGLPFDGDTMKLAKVKGATAYVGFAMTMKGNAGWVDLFVPHRAIEIASEATKPLRDDK